MSRIVDPVIADLQTECEQPGLSEARRHWLSWTWSLRLAAALALYFLVETVRPCGREGGRAKQTIACSFATFAAITAVFTLPPIIQAPGWGAPDTALLTLYVIPQALPLSIPVTLSVGVLMAMRSKRATASRLLIVAAAAACATIMALSIIEWLVPHANQLFRELVAARVTGTSVRLDPGLNEVGLSGLLRRGDPAALQHLSLLLALSFAAIPIALTALAVARRVRRAISGVLVGVALPSGYMMALFSALFSLDVPPSELTFQVLLTPWMPNALFLLGAAALLYQGRERQT